MPPQAQLSEQERRTIEAEELALAQARAARQAETERLEAAEAYRQEIREALRPRPGWWHWRWVLPFLPLLAAGAWLLRPTPPTVPDRTWGGIADSALAERCRTEVAGQTYGQESDLTFPDPAETAAGMTATPDGKRWEGWAERPDGTRLQFTCQFDPAGDRVAVEVMP